MENSKNNENGIGTHSFFETIFTKHKKILYALPILIVGIIVSLYYISNSKSDKKRQDLSNVDLSLPSSQTKELSDDKLAVVNEFNELSEAQNEDSKRGDKFDVENAASSIPKGDKYQDENDKAVVDKVDKMLREMDKEKKKQGGSSYSVPRTVITAPVKETNYESRANNDADFDAFFSSKTANSTTTINNEKQQTDVIIYASIKGDHLSLRNNSRVTLILPKETIIKGKVYKKNTLLYAQATFQGNRVNLSINNINQIPLNIKAYDAQDGNLGLQVDKSLIAETGSEVVSDGVDEVDLNGVPLGNTIKSLFKKKQQEPKIDLLNNQRLILKLTQ